MPTDINLSKKGMIYQREQYQKDGVGKKYWLYKDNLIINLVKNRENIVDIGCGEGILLEQLIKKFPKKEIFGIDGEKENIAICKKYNLDVRFGSVYKLPLEDSSIDCIIFMEVIEHLDRPDQAIREISRVLKKDGIVIILFPNDAMFKFARIATLNIKEAFYDTGHVKQWTPAGIKKVVRKFGLVPVSKKNLPFVVWPISLHHLIVAKKR